MSGVACPKQKQDTCHLNETTSYLRLLLQPVNLADANLILELRYVH